jgi:hypothetical protein
MNATFNIEEIKTYFRNNNFLITNHARIRMFQRNISTAMVTNIIQNSEIIETYFDD